VDRSHGPMDKNRIQGGADQGERANDHEALVVKDRWRRSGGRVVKECVLTRGDLALRMKVRRSDAEREVSRGRSSRRRRRAEGMGEQKILGSQGAKVSDACESGARMRNAAVKPPRPVQRETHRGDRATQSPGRAAG